MRRSVSWDSAVAACPAPIVATSRKPSSRNVCRSSSCSWSHHSSRSDHTRQIQQQRGPALVQHRGAGDPARHAVGRSTGCTTASTWPCTASASNATRCPFASKITAGRRRGGVPTAILQQPAQVHHRHRAPRTSSTLASADRPAPRPGSHATSSMTWVSGIMYRSVPITVTSARTMPSRVGNRIVKTVPRPGTVVSASAAPTLVQSRDHDVEPHAAARDIGDHWSPS